MDIAWKEEYIRVLKPLALLMQRLNIGFVGYNAPLALEFDFFGCDPLIVVDEVTSFGQERGVSINGVVLEAIIKGLEHEVLLEKEKGEK